MVYRVVRSVMLGIMLAAALSDVAFAASSLLDVNMAGLIARADLNYPQPPARSEEGIPIGNGRMGTLLWTSSSTLRMQINRVDVFGSNCATNSFPERHTDYCGGCAFVDIELPAEAVKGGVFAGERAPQRLSCYDALATLEGAGVKTRALAANDRDVIAVEVSDSRGLRAPLVARLRMLRPPVVKTQDHTATSRVEVRGRNIILTQKFEEGDYYCGSAVVIGIPGAQVSAKLIGEREVQLSAQPGNGPLTVFVASAASMDRGEDIVAAALDQLQPAAEKGFSGLYESNKAWWKDFWGKAFIHLHSAGGEADFVESQYNYFLYTMACCSRGKYPFKFNGMLWNTGGDRRAWGAQYWGANQGCFYNGLFPANRPELMKPMFDMYFAMSDSLALAARQQWGSQGIWIPETVAFDGLAPLPEEIAREMQDLYLLKKPWSERSQRFYDYCLNRPPHASRYNWKTGGKWGPDGKWITAERGGGPYGPVTHIFSRGAKIAYQFWMQYEYSLELDWLRDRAYPMIKGEVEFYRNYPNLVKERDGKYHIYYVNDNEPLWGGRDTSEEISAMMAILPAAIRASEILNVDADLRAKWRELLKNLAPLPTSDLLNTTMTPSIQRYPTFTQPAGRGGKSKSSSQRDDRSTSERRWVKGLPPSVNGLTAGRPDGNTAPQWFFDLCNLESDNPEMLKLAGATYPGGANSGARVGVLSKAAGIAAMMGRAEDFRNLVLAQLRPTEGSLQNMANHMTLKEGPQTQCNEQQGRAADALHMALVQSAPPGPEREPVIRLFPAWPKDWDADFTLLCRGGFLVTASIKGGRIEFVELQSQACGECRLRNPWGGPVALFRNGKVAETLDGSLLKFTTVKGETIVVVRSGATPAQFKRKVLGMESHD